ncbi:MAG: acetyl-CoA C-acyltransferase family protein [Zoogloeaceae bacterium]|jgi:acetyl-CoA C-acetyltransferase|nr:acetyl-CoA C-acyltransferase family protein [Zoogloeaceae bacterium]
MLKDIVVLAAARSAIGAFGGSLKDLEPIDLGTLVIKETIARSKVDPKQISFAALGNIMPTEARYPYVARVATIQGGLAMDSIAFSVNRLCGSAMQAVISSAQAIMLGDAEFALAGGIESMTRAAYLLPALRNGARMGDVKALDSMVSVITDPFGVGHMGMTAENLAVKWGISREEQDAYAVESQKRAAAAVKAGYFKDQIVPITLKSRKGDVVFDSDEQVKADTTLETLAKMKPAFKKEGGTVTAGNASTLNDAAAFLVLADAAKASAAGYKPMARLVSYAIAGVPNDVMGEGPIPASKLALQRAGLTLDQIDVIEGNEAFAAQAITVAKGLGLDHAKTNPNGGAIALGHPVSATGSVIITKLLHEMQRTGKRYGLATMCIGGGQGIATIYERL